MTDKILNNKYKIIEQIGCGGMALVYKAIDLDTSEQVAVKILKPELAQDEFILRRFNQEAHAASVLSHPNIVKMKDVGCDTDIHYIVLDYIDGITLKEYIDKNKPLNPYEAAEITLQITEGLRHAHDNGIIHRDIKPHNIIIQNDKSIKITDFGIARIVGDATHTTQYGKDIIGTVYYSSPEQVRGLNVDARTDIYSLGVVLYEMVTGTVPFDGETAVSIAMQHVTKEPDSAKKYNKEVPHALENIIHNAMAKQIDCRYKSINYMIRDLKRYINGANSIPIIKKSQPISLLKEGKKMPGKKQQEKQKAKLNALLINTFFIIVLSAILIILLLGIFKIGTKIFENNFVISKVETPYVVGKSSEEAKSMLQNKQLIYREISSQYSSTVPKGYIIEQNPSAGEQLKEDDLVNVIISLGAFYVDIPNFVGRDITSVELELISNRYIVLGKNRYVNDDSPEGTILSQSIDPGEFSLDGNSVTLTFDISLGSEKTTIIMRQLIGYTYASVEQLAPIYEFTIGKVRYEYSDSVEKDKIISQSIEAGTEIEKGSSVDFVVSLGPRTVNKKTIKIRLPSNIKIDEDGTVQMRMTYLSEGQYKDAYNGRIEVIDSAVEVTLENSGTVIYYIYVNDRLLGSQTVNFN